MVIMIEIDSVCNVERRTLCYLYVLYITERLGRMVERPCKYGKMLNSTIMTLLCEYPRVLGV